MKKLIEVQNVGVEEANPRRPHFCIPGENQDAGAGNRYYSDGENTKIAEHVVCSAKKMVRLKELEPTRLATQEPKGTVTLVTALYI